MDLGLPRKIRQGSLSALLMILALCISSTAARAAGPTILFNIPAGDAQKTLQQFYAQSHIEMLYLIDMVHGRKTNAITGSLDASTALGEMLKGTGLEYSFEEDYSFVSIRPKERAPMGSAAPIEVVTAATMSEVHDQLQPLQDALGSDVKIEEVVVTGTLIHGVLDIMSPLEFVTKKEMNNAAYSTVQNALQALPTNFGGGPSEDFSTTGNFAHGSSVNLRGLGAGATLVLVDAVRQPYSGMEGDFVDLTNIPSNAVDHIEVLPDGASALYGSDAIAGVVNVIMRKDFDGAETQVRFGQAPGGRGEKLVSQLFGARWDSGNFLASYQFSNLTALDASARAYAANTDKRSLGGTDHRSSNSNPGNIIDPMTFLPSLAIPRGQDGASLSADDLISSNINLQNQYTGMQLLPEQKTHSLFLNGSQRFGDNVELFADGRINDRYARRDYTASDSWLLVPATNPFSPYRGVKDVIVGYSFLNDLGPQRFEARTMSFSGNLGTRVILSESWKLKLSGSYGRETMNFEGHNQVDYTALQTALADSDPETAFNPFGDGSFTNPDTINAVRSVQHEYSRSIISAGHLVADGKVFDLPSGPAKLAVGSEWRKEEFVRGAKTRRSFDRSVKSVFAELAVPLIGLADDARAVPRLELSVAGRYESYSDFGSSTNPKIGLRWAPSASVKVRTSWGTSFKAPKLVDIYDSSRDLAGLTALADPSSPGGAALVLAIEGSNPLLREESSSTWTAGFDFAPLMLDGFKLSLTYYAIDYDNRIMKPAANNPADILLEEVRWSSVIQRNPTQSALEAACSATPLYEMTVSQCESTAVAAIVDFRVRNLGATRVRGIDMKIDQSVDTRLGRFDFGLNGAYVLSFGQEDSNTSPMTDVVNTVGNPLAFRMRGTAEWSQHSAGEAGFSMGATVDRFGGYKDPFSAARSNVSPFTTLDLRLGYRTSTGARGFDDVEVGLNAANVLNTAPPFVDNEAGYDRVNADPYGRVISLTIQKAW